MHLLRDAECLLGHLLDLDPDLRRQDVECHRLDHHKEDRDLRVQRRHKEGLDHRDPHHLREDLDHLVVYLRLQDLVRQEECHPGAPNRRCRCNDLDPNKHLWELEEPEDKGLSKVWSP